MAYKAVLQVFVLHRFAICIKIVWKTSKASLATLCWSEGGVVEVGLRG